MPRALPALANCVDDAFALLPAEGAVQARAALQACFDAATDDTTRRLCAAGMLLAMAADFADFRGRERWLARLVPEPHDLQQGPACDQAQPPNRPQDRARLDAALVVVPLLDGAWSTQHPAVVAAAKRLVLALAAPVDGAEVEALAITPDERMLLWKCLFDYRAHCMDTVALLPIAAQAQDFMRRGGVSPRWQALWWLLMARNHGYFGATDAGVNARERARALAQAHGLADVRYELLCVAMGPALRAESWALADSLARDIEQALPDMPAGRLPAGLLAQAWCNLSRNEPAAALLRLKRLLAVCADVEVPQRDRGAYQVAVAYALLALGRFDQALTVLRAQRVHQQGEQGQVLGVLIDLAAGLAGVHAGQSAGQPAAVDAARATVCDAVRRCAALNFERFLLPLPALSAQVAQMALDAGVETEFMTAVVRARKLVPADPAREDWPWRLHVRVLGGLVVLRDGRALALSGKRPKKPLELLALLAAQGTRPLAMEAAIAALWPTTEADSPKAALEVALARLRKLLDVPGAVLLADGGLRLDLRMVWTDVAAFDVLEQRWQNHARTTPTQAVSEDAASAQATALQSASRAARLYGGPLLAGETVSAPWQVLREQLARRCTRLVAGWGAALQAQGLWQEAVEAYGVGLAGDPLSEPLYRALMRAQLQLGERAEALRSFARCRDLLASVLGVAPSHDTLALRDRAAASG